MATIQQIQDALNSLGGGGPIDKKIIIKEVFKKALKSGFGDAMTEENLEKIVEETIKNTTSPLYLQVSSVVDELNVAISTIPTLATSLISQNITNVALSDPFSASSKQSLIASVKSQASNLKSTLGGILSKAASLGVDIPGIDPLLEAIKIIGPLL